MFISTVALGLENGFAHVADWDEGRSTFVQDTIPYRTQGLRRFLDVNNAASVALYTSNKPT